MLAESWINSEQPDDKRRIAFVIFVNMLVIGGINIAFTKEMPDILVELQLLLSDMDNWNVKHATFNWGNSFTPSPGSR